MFLHQQVQIGDVLHISEPRHGFPLRRNVPRTMLIAGGIGITPLLPMAGALASMDLPFLLHYFAASEDDVAFGEELERFGDRVQFHLGFTPVETATALGTLLAQPPADAQVYACGPPPMLDAIRRTATEAGWPDARVHFEYFRNTTGVDATGSFTVELARSAKTLQVPEGRSILDVLREEGIPMVSSCEQGACGTCIAAVIDGEPHHQDVYLNESERAAGRHVLTCVSRSHGDRLVLDL